MLCAGRKLNQGGGGGWDAENYVRRMERRHPKNNLSDMINLDLTKYILNCKLLRKEQVKNTKVQHFFSSLFWNF